MREVSAVKHQSNRVSHDIRRHTVSGTDGLCHFNPQFHLELRPPANQIDQQLFFPTQLGLCWELCQTEEAICFNLLSFFV